MEGARPSIHPAKRLTRMPNDAPGPLGLAAAYREHAPPPALRDALVCVWSHASAPDGVEVAQPVAHWRRWRCARGTRTRRT